MLPLTVMISIAILVFLVSIILDQRRISAFNARFPPLSDAEFLARCTPGTKPEIALKVRRIVAKQLNIEYERVYPESSFVNDLRCD